MRRTGCPAVDELWIAGGVAIGTDAAIALLADRWRLRCTGINQGPRRRRLLTLDRPAGAGMATDTKPAVLTHPLAPRSSHIPARAKRVIFLFMNGGPSHVDTFDPKPALERYAGQSPPARLVTGRPKAGKVMPSPFRRDRGQSGIEVTDLFPHVASCIDDLCVIRSMYTDNPNHEPSLLMMNSGNMQPIRPSLGSWLTFGLGTENQNLPGFVVLCPGKPVVGPQLWSNSFLPGIYQGTHINNESIDPKRIIRDVTNPHLSDARTALAARPAPIAQSRAPRRTPPDEALETRIARSRWHFGCSTRHAKPSTWVVNRR